MKKLLILFLGVVFISCKKEDDPVTEPAIENPSISCGTSWTTDCLNKFWVVNKEATASITISPDGFNGKNSLFFYNPHGPNEVSPPLVRLNTVIKNIKKDVPYKISFYAKLKGYPYDSNSPSLAAYAFTDNDWYNQMYYGSPRGVYHDEDWSEHSFLITGKEVPSLEFEIYSAYDSTWISDLKIQAL